MSTTTARYPNRGQSRRTTGAQGAVGGLVVRHGFVFAVVDSRRPRWTRWGVAAATSRGPGRGRAVGRVGWTRARRADMCFVGLAGDDATRGLGGGPGARLDEARVDVQRGRRSGMAQAEGGRPPCGRGRLGLDAGRGTARASTWGPRRGPWSDRAPGPLAGQRTLQQLGTGRDDLGWGPPRVQSCLPGSAWHWSRACSKGRCRPGLTVRSRREPTSGSRSGRGRCAAGPGCAATSPANAAPQPRGLSKSRCRASSRLISRACDRTICATGQGNTLAAATGASTKELMARMGACLAPGGADLPTRHPGPRPGHRRRAATSSRVSPRRREHQCLPWLRRAEQQRSE